MKILIIILLCMITTNSNAQKSWFQKNQDKIAHFGVGYIAGSISYKILSNSTENKWKARVGSVLITGMIAGIKEYTDRSPSNKDILYTVLGSITHISITF